MTAVQDSIVARVARWHYGLAYNVHFDPKSEVHRSLGESRIKWDRAEDRYQVTGKMEWIVKKVFLT